MSCPQVDQEPVGAFGLRCHFKPAKAAKDFSDGAGPEVLLCVDDRAISTGADNSNRRWR